MENIIIRADFLIEELRKSIIVNNTFHKSIIQCWKDDIRFLISAGDDCEQIYDFKNKEDLKECIDMGLSAEDIAYLVNKRDDNNYTQFFTYSNINFIEDLHILSKEEVMKSISKDIVNIAYNVLKYPYKGDYAELYRQFVAPMITLNEINRYC